MEWSEDKVREVGEVMVVKGGLTKPGVKRVIVRCPKIVTLSIERIEGRIEWVKGMVGEGGGGRVLLQVRGREAGTWRARRCDA